MRCVAASLASLPPPKRDGFLDSLTRNALAAFPWLFEFWAIPGHQLLQFQSATLQPGGERVLSGLLRGQAGTDGLAPLVIPAGARFVLLDGAPQQLPLSLAVLGLSRNYRIGPASAHYADPSYVAETHAFPGVGLRPYAPAQLRALRNANGDLIATWVRRARYGGDSWQGVEPPLGEAFERYEVRVMQGASTARVVNVDTPAFTYAGADQAADGVANPFTFSVRQVSAEFGPGLASETIIND